MTWIVLIVALLSVGCSQEATDSRRPASIGATGTGGVVGGAAQVPNSFSGTGCSPVNMTQGCECGAQPGRQVCGRNRKWGPCECAATTSGTGGSVVIGQGAGDPAANKQPASFSWLRTEPGTGGAGDCKPGHYDGSLDGLYNAPSAFNAPVPIVSVDVTGAAGFQIDLAKGGSGEFLTVTGGKFSGVALAIFPFEADLADGRLDCATGLFRARIINGTYVVFFDGAYGGKVMYEFEGELVARYDAATASLVDGRWSVTEGSVPPPAISPDQPPPVFPPAQAGGTGTWTAQWTR